MANTFFSFKQFTIHQDQCAMKVTTDACLFGAWTCEELRVTEEPIGSILDIGTGTGLLSLMLAQQDPNYLIKAIEIDNKAAEQAARNVGNSPFHKQIVVAHADIREVQLSKKADVIISNPPFYEDELRSPDQHKNKAHHDESLLLGELIPIIKRHLRPGGCFFLLLPYKRRSAIEKLLRDQELSIEKEVLVKPSPTKDFFRIMLKGRHWDSMFAHKRTTEMEITNSKGVYTEEVKSLLKNYYLYL